MVQRAVPHAANGSGRKGAAQSATRGRRAKPRCGGVCGGATGAAAIVRWPRGGSETHQPLGVLRQLGPKQGVTSPRVIVTRGAVVPLGRSEQWGKVIR